MGLGAGTTALGASGWLICRLGFWICTASGWAGGGAATFFGWRRGAVARMLEQTFDCCWPSYPAGIAGRCLWLRVRCRRLQGLRCLRGCGLRRLRRLHRLGICLVFGRRRARFCLRLRRHCRRLRRGLSRRGRFSRAWPAAASSPLRLRLISVGATLACGCAGGTGFAGSGAFAILSAGERLCRFRSRLRRFGRGKRRLARSRRRGRHEAAQVKARA